MPRRISYSRGKGKLSHNTREMMPKNADPERTRNNQNLICMDVQTAYDKIFGEAQAEYNAKQKRKDRKIDNYFVKTFGEPPKDEVQIEPGAKNPRHSFYEYAVGIGSMEDTAIVDRVLNDGTIINANPQAAETAMLCLMEYINGSDDGKIKPFQERNPNFYVFNAQIHMDETTPHLHYDFIPFADGYRKGMTRQQSISKALEQMGYGTGENAILNFTESERQVFQQICENHGFEVAEPEKGRGQTIETQQYGIIQDAKRAAKAEIEQAAADAKQELTQTKAEQERAHTELAATQAQTAAAKAELAEMQEQALAYNPGAKRFGETQAAYNARVATAQQAAAVLQRTAEQDARQRSLDEQQHKLDAMERNIDAISAAKAKELAAKPIADARMETAAVRAELTAERTAHRQTQARLSNITARLRDTLTSLFPPHWVNINTNAHHKFADQLRKGATYADLERRQRYQPAAQEKSQNQTESRLYPPRR